MKYTTKQLLKMPNRKDENMSRFYDWLLVVPDDINWLIPDSNRGKYQLAHLRTDCFYPQGVLKFWGRGKFQVNWGPSTEIKFIPNEIKK